MAQTKIGDTRAKELVAIANSTFGKKSSYDALCQEIADNFHPMRADFLSNKVIGANYASHLMESTPALMREALGNYIEAVLRQGRWFKIGTGDEDRDNHPENASSLGRLTQLMRNVTGSRHTLFSTSAKELDHDYVAFGVNCWSWDAPLQRDRVVLRAWHPKSCAWLLDEFGQMFLFFRKLEITAADYVHRIKSGRWTGSEIPQAVQTAYDKDPGQMFPIMHIMAPADYVYGSDGPKLRDLRHRFLSCYVDCENDAYLHEAGSKTFKYGAGRWRTLQGFNYGFSPAAMLSLPDARMAQMLALIMLEQGEKALDPPMVGAGDIFTRDINVYAGGFTMIDLPDDARLADKMTTIDTSKGFSVGIEMKQDVRALLQEAWLIGKLTLPKSDQLMTAYEASLRNEEYRRTALPFISPIEQSYHTPVLSTGLDEAIAIGLVLPDMMTQDLAEREADFTFDTPLNQAEGLQVVATYERTLQLLAEGSQADDTISNMVDLRRATEDAIRGAGAKPTWFVSDATRKKKDAQAEQAKQLAAAAAMARQGAGATADVANATIAAQNAGISPQGVPPGATVQ